MSGPTMRRAGAWALVLAIAVGWLILPDSGVVNGSTLLVFILAAIGVALVTASEKR